MPIPASILRAAVVSLAALTPLAHAAPRAFFHLEKIDNRWWFLDPAGHPFLSKGVTSVTFTQDAIGKTSVHPYGDSTRAKYGSIDAWRVAEAKRLFAWGFNTLGAWSDEKLADIDVDGKHLAYAPTLDLGAAFVASATHDQAWLHGIFPDVFDPAFEPFVKERAAKRCAPLKNDPKILGWFTDNELRWGPDWRGTDELLTLFLNLPHDAPGRRAALDLLQRHHAQIADLNAVWQTHFASWDDLAAADKITAPFSRKRIEQNAEVTRTADGDHARAFLEDADAFLALLAENYFRITAAAIHAADPNHLNFGSRFAYVPAAPVVHAASHYLDAVSFNCYNRDPYPVIEQYATFQKPLIIGEFAFRAADSGLPNTKGAGVKVATQTERADAFAAYVTSGLHHPNLVGYHWFEHADEPKEGRFDGENSNYGIVDIHDNPYELLLKKMLQISNDAQTLHQH